MLSKIDREILAAFCSYINRGVRVRGVVNLLANSYKENKNKEFVQEQCIKSIEMWIDMFARSPEGGNLKNKLLRDNFDIFDRGHIFSKEMILQMVDNMVSDACN